MIKKNLLITGGLGYIGSKFFTKFKEEYSFYIIDTSFFSPKDLEQSSNVNYLDIRKVNIEDLKNIDLIVHMGELSNDPLGNISNELTNEINHEATMKLLDLANNSDVKKFIYMSSASIYGISDEISSELSTVNPLTEYAKAKYNNEQYILNTNFDFETIILRNSTAFGYSDNLRLDLVVNDLTFNAFKNNQITLLSDGSPKRPIVHVADICNFINLILNDDNSHDKEIYNVGDKTLNYSIKQIAETIGEVLNIDKIKYGEFDSDQRSYYLDFSKIEKKFPKFQIEYNLKKGVQDLIRNFRSYNLSGNEERLKKLEFLIKNNKLNNKLYWN